MASWSQLEAGNWRTAKFIFLFATESQGTQRRDFEKLCVSAPRRLIGNFQFVILNHRVAQKFVACLVEGLARGFPIRAIQFNFEIFADVNGLDALVPHLFERIPDGFALGVHHGPLWSNDNFCFHLRAPGIRGLTREFWGKWPRRASNF